MRLIVERYCDQVDECSSCWRVAAVSDAVNFVFSLVASGREAAWERVIGYGRVGTFAEYYKASLPRGTLTYQAHSPPWVAWLACACVVTEDGITSFRTLYPKRCHVLLTILSRFGISFIGRKISRRRKSNFSCPRAVFVSAQTYGFIIE